MEDMEGDAKPFRLFSGKFKPSQQTVGPTSNPLAATTKTTHTDKGDPGGDASGAVGFSELGLSKWAVDTCRELGIRSPTPVQRRCIPRILAGDDVLGIAQTGSGKTAAFALPILQRLATEPYGVFALVITPTRELACQLAEQFRALGSTLHLRCTLIIGGINMMGQAQALMQRPHIVVATPGRIKVLLSEDQDISAAFSKIKFLVLDEADRVLDVGFEEELRIIFKSLPKSRQTLLFSATMTSQLQALLELSANRLYFFEAYEGFKTVESLKQQYIFIPKNVKEVYLFHILSKMEDMSVRSAMIFVSTCRYDCRTLAKILDRGLRRTVSHRTVRGAAQQRRIPAPRHGRPRLPPEALCPPIEMVRHAVGRHRYLESHLPRHLLPHPGRHHLLRQLPLQPRHASRDRLLPLAAEEGAQIEAAIPRPASKAVAHLHVRPPVGIPHLRDGARQLEGVRGQRLLDCVWLRLVLLHGVVQEEGVFDVRHSWGDGGRNGGRRRSEAFLSKFPSRLNVMVTRVY